MILNNDNHNIYFVVNACYSDKDGVVTKIENIFKTNDTLDLDSLVSALKKRNDDRAYKPVPFSLNKEFGDCILKEKNSKGEAVYYCFDVIISDDKIEFLKNYDHSAFMWLIDQFYPYTISDSYLFADNKSYMDDITLERTYTNTGAGLYGSQQRTLGVSNDTNTIVDILMKDIRFEHRNGFDEVVVAKTPMYKDMLTLKKVSTDDESGETIEETITYRIFAPNANGNAFDSTINTYANNAARLKIYAHLVEVFHTHKFLNE